MAVITLLNEKDHAKWDEYVETSPTGTFYHLYGWKEVIRNAYGLKPYYLVRLNQTGDIVGILPLFLMHNILFENFLISNPYTNYCGICADSESIENELVKYAKQLSGELNAQYLELRCLGEKTGRSDQVRGEFVNMMLDLSEGDDSIWNKTINSKVRNSVRKGIKSELEFDLGKDYFDDFYRVFATNMRDLGTPVHSKLFFKHLIQIFHDRIEIFVVKHQGKVVGSMFGFSRGKIISEPWASTLRSVSKYCAADFLYWHAIQYACEEGFSQFDFGRSTLNTGTYQFKKKWGAKPVSLTYQYYLNLADGAPIEIAEDNKYQMAVTIWQKLPLFLANIMGPAVIKYLPEL